MATILVYNNSSNRMETYYRGLSEAMPYITNRTLTVREFRANSSSNILWTTTSTMRAWNNFRSIYGRSIFVGFAFKRCWEGGHGNQSQHYSRNSLWCRTKFVVFRAFSYEKFGSKFWNLDVCWANFSHVCVLMIQRVDNTKV